MAETVLVVHASVYEFKDPDTGVMKSGCKVAYLPQDPDPRADATGIPELSLTGPKELFAGINGKLPAIAELDTRQVPGRRGSVSLALVGVNLKAHVDITALIKKMSSPA